MRMPEEEACLLACLSSCRRVVCFAFAFAFAFHPISVPSRHLLLLGSEGMSDDAGEFLGQ